jgi:hypothetical protein
MKMTNQNCKIVQDLLPSYIDKLTSSETNNYIEQHLRECKECQKCLLVMKKGLETEHLKDVKQIDYLKKYKNKMRLLKLISALVVVCLVLFTGIKVYKWQVLLKIYKHNVNYELGTNYKLTQRDGSTGIITEKYYKNGIRLVKRSDGIIIWENSKEKYFIDENKKAYIELQKDEPPVLDFDTTATIGVSQILNETISKSELLLLTLKNTIDIHVEEYGKHKCIVLLLNNEKIWIDKESLFILRDDFEGKSNEFSIETNTVTDDELVKPNIENFKKLNK